VFKSLSAQEYFALQEYQNEHQVQVMYPMQATHNTNFATANGGALFWYKLVDETQGSAGAALRDENGNLIPNYLTSDDKNKAKYDSLRIEGDNGGEDGNTWYTYAVKNQTGYKVRLDYHEYYKYVNGHEPVFLFGTNAYGQDIFTCLAAGARLSFLLAIFVSIINLTLGTIYGSIEGYYGGAVDITMERISDILASVPFIVVATLFQLHLAEKVGALPSLLFAFVMTGWVGMASRVRMQFYRFKGQEYILAARTLGAKDGRLMFKHILPNSIGTIITGAVLSIPGVIFSESMLSYLGIVNLETSSTLTSVGTMLSQGQGYLYTHPHIILFPAVFIALLEISFNLFGNGLRDAFNPSLRGVEE
jgi:oligopeptide transport system permease protein